MKYSELLTTREGRNVLKKVVPTVLLIFALIVLFLAMSGCGVADAMRDLESRLPIDHGFQANNITDNVEGEGWLNGESGRATIDPGNNRRFEVTFDGNRGAYGSLTIKVVGPNGETGSIQLKRWFKKHTPEVIAVTIENRGEPMVCQKVDNGRKECKSPMRNGEF